MACYGRVLLFACLLTGVLAWTATTRLAMAQPSTERIGQALQNITNLVRANQIGYAAFWDGNKYIQCRRLPERDIRCEASGMSLQPSLRNVLTGQRLNRIAALGWVLDPSFGNFAQTFSANTSSSRIADVVMQTLIDGYAAEAANLEVLTAWIADIPCPPRNGFSQNLAGMVNDAPAMRSTAIRTCSFVPPVRTAHVIRSADDLFAVYEATAAAELQRLRINLTRKVFVVFDAGIGYVQCVPDTTASAIYCEAQSAESWAPLTSVLTPTRIGLLHKMGYADPGRAPNYYKNYSLAKFTDAAIAKELLTILHGVYGYTGTPPLKISTK